MDSSGTGTSLRCFEAIGVGKDITKLTVSSTPIYAIRGSEGGRTSSTKTSDYGYTLAGEIDSIDPNTFCTIVG